MQITLANGTSHTINSASDIADLEIEGQKITNYNPEDGEDDIEFINTDHLAAYFEQKENGTDEAALLAWLSNVQPKERDEDYIEKFHEAYSGAFDSVKDFAEDYCRDAYTEELSSMSNIFKSAINWEAVWDSELRHDFWESNGHYFNANI